MTNPVLQLKGIVKTFPSLDKHNIEVLRGIDFVLNAGESVSLRGESGSGKTTLLNIAACLDKTTSGEIHWNSTRVDKLSNSRQARLRAKYMGFVFQSYCLLQEIDALENVVFASRIAGNYNKSSHKRAREILDRVGLGDRMKHLPNQLSGGERQRVAIARAIINLPSVILADEPTGNLDEETGLEVMEMFLKLCEEENAALLLITHNPDFAKKTQRSLVLAHGKIKE